MILREWGLLGALLALNSMALAMVGWELGVPDAAVESIQVLANAEPAPSIQPLPLPPPPTPPGQVIAERSLFVPGRHAEPPPPSPPPPVIMPVVPSIVASLTLLGTVGGPGDRIALLKASSPPEVLRVRVGRHFEGWEVAEIKSDRVVLQAGGRREEIKLPYGGNASSALTPPPPMASPLAPPIPGGFIR